MVLTVENESTRGRTCPNANSSTTNPTWSGLALNPVLHDEKSTTQHLSLGMVLSFICRQSFSQFIPHCTLYEMIRRLQMTDNACYVGVTAANDSTIIKPSRSKSRVTCSQVCYFYVHPSFFSA